MEILFLSHCVPYPPNKGEKIRAFHEIKALTEAGHRVHLACFGRTAEDVEHARALEGCCASAYVEHLHFARSLFRGCLQFAAGSSLNMGFFRSRTMSAYVTALASQTPLDRTVVYTVPMLQYAPRRIFTVLDFVDVDSEKWFQYSQTRRLGLVYRAEAKRLRKTEIGAATHAQALFFTTGAEAGLYSEFSGTHASAIENGVDFAYFDPATVSSLSGLSNRKYVAFIGVLDYYPNIEAVSWFARRVMPSLRAVDPRWEFIIVGRNPVKSVRALGRLPGIEVMASVPDVRPYLASAKCIVVPLRIARGIQNKVLEALAMGKTVLASNAVCRTFGAQRLEGIVPCGLESDYIDAALRSDVAPAKGHVIRAAAQKRFRWRENLGPFCDAVEHAVGRVLPVVSI